MQRNIMCVKCGPRFTLLVPEDIAMGFDARQVRIVAKRPEGHGIAIYSDSKVERSETPLLCDMCGEQISDGEIVYARTVWNTTREGTPGNWEKDYGTVIPDEAAKVAEQLSKPTE